MGAQTHVKKYNFRENHGPKMRLAHNVNKTSAKCNQNKKQQKPPHFDSGQNLIFLIFEVFLFL